MGSHRVGHEWSDLAAAAAALSAYYMPDSVQGTGVEEREAKIPAFHTSYYQLDSSPLLSQP